MRPAPGASRSGAFYRLFHKACPAPSGAYHLTGTFYAGRSAIGSAALPS